MLESKISQRLAKLSMQPTQHSMQPAGLGLDKIVPASFARRPADEAPLLAWPLACGSAVAERTRALNFADGVLRVEVPDAGWRTELQTLAPQVCRGHQPYVSENVSAD